jgi:hypothetical protein
MGDKVMSKKLMKLEKRIAKEIATPKHKYLSIGNLSIHLDKRYVSGCTEGRYHDPITFPKKLRILWVGKNTWVKVIPLEKVCSEEIRI